MVDDNTDFFAHDAISCVSGRVLSCGSPQMVSNRETGLVDDKATDQPGYGAASRDYLRIERALNWLSDHRDTQPSLADVAATSGLSEYHFQRTFSRWVGISPKKFLQYLTLDRAKRSLESASSVMDAALDAGLSGPGRLHDLFTTLEAVTPGEYKSHGAGLTIRYGFHNSPFGECLLTHTERGICGLAFVIGDDRADALEELKSKWKNADFVEDAAATAPLIERIFPSSAMPANREPLKLLVRGTPFQVKVWQALLSIPPGSLVTYSDIAEHIGTPNAVRAVGTANGSNAISYLIPCHRVIRKSGVIGGYRWGRGRKLALIGWEAAQAEGKEPPI